MTLDADVAQLARTRPFSLLPREAVQLIAFSSVKRRLKAGEILFHAGEEGEAGYFVHSGAILLIGKGGRPESARRGYGRRPDRRACALCAGRQAGRGSRH